MTTHDCDFLVIGSGLAGLISALRLAPHGRVVLATKRGLIDSNTNWAQGGVACALDPDDSIEAHVQDTLDVGGGLCHEAVVREILGDGPARIRDLEAYGVQFAAHPTIEGQYELGREAGHSARRVLHSGDITGHAIAEALVQQVLADSRIRVLEHALAIDLVTTGWMELPGPSRCIGAYFLDRSTESVFAVRAPATLLASGGAGKVYLYTTNPDTATGDGIAMAWRAGLPIVNMEFVQFHPTCLFHPTVKSFLISEAVRGEGGRLVNAAGEAFMTRYDPRGDLAPRDIVARAIDHHMKTRGDTCVYIDITHRSRDFLQERFPTIYATCLQCGYDMATQPIPVVPAAHYFCGGVEADVDGRTALPGLYAIGETSFTGLHGANRLASNSLLEALVCAHRCAEAIAASRENAGLPADLDIPAWQSGDAVPSDEAVVVEHNWNEIRTCMWDYVGIVRTDKRLERALNRIENLRREIRQYYLAYTVTADTLELRNITAIAALIVRSAQMRKESRGLHYSLDHSAFDVDAPPHDTRIEDPPGGIP